MTDADRTQTWTLARWPDGARMAYQALAVCPHGRTYHIVYAGPGADLATSIRSLSSAHADVTHCLCRVGEVSVDDAVLPSPGDAP